MNYKNHSKVLKELTKNGKYFIVNEIFYSIQGEGKTTGKPTVFIRLQGCNLACDWCDTKYSNTPSGKSAKLMTQKEIINKVESFGCKEVCLTGGEPLIQPCSPLLLQLSYDGYSVGIETNGSVDLSPFLTTTPNFYFSMDIKCPSSKMNKYMEWNNLNLLGEQDQLKFVIADRKDYNFAKGVIDSYPLRCKIYFCPAGGVNCRRLFKWIVKDKLNNVRLGFQLHKIAYPSNKRGV